jgi:hypothetical protein
LFLPPSLRSYRPYVDPSSSASSVPQTQLSERLEEWFRKSMEGLQHAVKAWFADLQGAREVWNVRTSILNSIDATSGIDQAENSSLKSCFDHACLERLLDIWKGRLQEAGQKFGDRLASVTTSITKDDDIRPKGSSTGLGRTWIMADWFFFQTSTPSNICSKRLLFLHSRRTVVHSSRLTYLFEDTNLPCNSG